MPTLQTATGQDALARLDNGTQRPGDHELAAAYDLHCQQQWEAIALDQANREYDNWLATQCRLCGPDGSTGDPCAGCHAGAVLAEAEMGLAA